LLQIGKKDNYQSADAHTLKRVIGRSHENFREETLQRDGSDRGNGDLKADYNVIRNAGDLKRLVVSALLVGPDDACVAAGSLGREIHSDGEIVYFGVDLKSLI
jgi:hypothetical protein